MKHKKLTCCRGIALVEWIMLAAIMVVIFIAASVYLRTAGQNRANDSMDTAYNSAPCGDPGGLSGDQCL